nr:immunoglobulin heavy chain junction region [Macaca mulatta]MOX59920.1 immunoglobulin heavy chain junction region [Macaca mulatta]MOX60030.1 immunoglobulin heavy chain junction region [Macaca mulatta]MOX60244.1 immunoglobulin heavy chain junction region [Macaca mulatta]MOX61685.1 immunoglobulin heavy chain junction region [Macaca mulatta]
CAKSVNYEEDNGYYLPTGFDYW